MSEREKGWYWVKQTGSAFWECCQWNGYAWHGIWIESVPDSGFSEIGQRIPAPGEPWQTVPLEITDDMIEHGVTPADISINMINHLTLSAEHSVGVYAGCTVALPGDN